MAIRILKSYPDPSKVQPEYVANLTALLAGFPVTVREKLGRPDIGILRHYTWIPSPKQVSDLAEKFMAEEAELEDYRKRYAGRQATEFVRVPHDARQMFWQLAEAFPDHPEYFYEKSFEELDGASIALMKFGRKFAEEALKAPPVSKRKAYPQRRAA